MLGIGDDTPIRVYRTVYEGGAECNYFVFFTYMNTRILLRHDNYYYCWDVYVLTIYIKCVFCTRVFYRRVPGLAIDCLNGTSN